MALRQADVRYHLIGGQSYFDRREIKDFLSYLKVFVNPHDDVSLLRIANVPARGLSDVTMERLLASSQERRCSVFSAMRPADVQEQFPVKTRESISAFVEFIDRTRLVLTTEPSIKLSQWAERFLAETGYINDLRRSDKNPETSENRVRNLKELIGDLDDHNSAKPIDGLHEFLEELALDSEREEEK